MFNKTDNASVRQHRGACAYCLYLLGYPNSTIPFHSKRAPSRRYNVTENNKMHLGLRVKCPICLPNFNQIFIFVTDLPKRPEYKIHRNPFGGSRADTCGQADTRTGGRTYIMKVIGAFPDYTIELKTSGTNESHSSFDTGKVLNSLRNTTGPAAPTYVWYCSKVCYWSLWCSYFLLPPK